MVLKKKKKILRGKSDQKEKYNCSITQLKKGVHPPMTVDI